jgi:hypothetical protein
MIAEALVDVDQPKISHILHGRLGGAPRNA